MKEKIVAVDDHVSCPTPLLLTVHDLQYTAAGASPDCRRLNEQRMINHYAA
ncbi:hypothetical protein [Paenibacillus mesotrionivorans]|uniref:Uncharacterized protein n=1 Tax=Paenibacillus mesotrionivorans TaxID=3160968 RepID=A0ACC7P415_9BACL